MNNLQKMSPALTLAATTIGLIWAVLVMVVGALLTKNLSTVVKLYGTFRSSGVPRAAAEPGH